MSPPAVYSPELVARVCKLYQDGHSLTETGRRTGTTRWKTTEILRRNGIEIRPQHVYAPLTVRTVRPLDTYLRGPDHPGWAGDQVSYSAGHNRVYKARGQPQECSRCGTADPDKDYDWANLTGRYGDVSDYERMCRSCHTRFDKARKREQ